MRKIIHIDMDCFFAAIEQKINPSLKGKPVAVGGSPGKRGVIATASYEARAFGVKSAMSSSQAVKLCPQLIIVRGHFDIYKDYSKQIREVFKRYTSKIQPLSLDEAYLDVSEYLKENTGSATILAQRIRQEVFEETGLTCSAGIAPNKLLAKIASDIKKPNGQFTIAPSEIENFMKDLPVKKIWGVGKVTQNKLLELGIKTCGELQKLTLSEIQHYFGKFGGELYQFCRGQDQREVETQRVRKSLSVENTFITDYLSADELRDELHLIFQELELRLRQKSQPPIKTIFVKVKYIDFKNSTIERPYHSLVEGEFSQLLEELFRKRSYPIRLLGLGVKFLTSDKAQAQQSFSFLEPS